MIKLLTRLTIVLLVIGFCGAPAIIVVVLPMLFIGQGMKKSLKKVK